MIAIKTKVKNRQKFENDIVVSDIQQIISTEQGREHHNNMKILF